MWKGELLRAIEHREVEEYPESVRSGSNRQLFHSIAPARGNLFAWMNREPGAAALDLFGNDAALVPALAYRFDKLAVFTENEAQAEVCKKVLEVEKLRNGIRPQKYGRDSSLQYDRWARAEVAQDVVGWLFGRGEQKHLEKFRKNFRYKAVIAVKEDLGRNQIFDIIEGSRDLLTADGSLWLLAEAGSSELIREAAERAGYGQILEYRCDPDWMFADHIELYEKTELLNDWIELVDAEGLLDQQSGLLPSDDDSRETLRDKEKEPAEGGRQIWTTRNGATNGGKRPEGSEKVLYQISAAELSAYMIFARFSNQRREKYRIITTEWMDSGEIRLYKFAAARSGASHIEHMRQMYELLDRQYGKAPSAFYVNRITPMENDTGVQLEYLAGCTLESMILDKLKSGREEEARKLVEKLFLKIRGPVLKIHPFRVTDKFIRYFGLEPEHFSDYTLGVSDIDMMLDNVIVEGSRWSFIDYEWSFDFPIPLKFIYFRTMFYYALKYPEYGSWAESVMRKEAGITREDQDQFTLMEDFFQRNWILDRDSLMEIRKRFRIRELTGTCGFMPWEDKAYEAKVYWAEKNSGYSEASSEVLSRICREEGSIVHIFVPQGTVSLRFDPAQIPGLFTMVSITDEKGKALDWSGSGYYVDRNQMFFSTDDPQIDILLNRNTHRIRVQYFYDGIYHPENIDLVGTPEAEGAVLHRHALVRERLGAMVEKLKK